MTDFDTYLKRIARDLHKLEATADGQGRKPARARVLGAIRLLRAAVDRSYPAVITRGKVVRLKTYEGRAERLQRAGYRAVHMTEAAVYAAEGVTVKRVQARKRDGALAIGFFVPAWAVAAKCTGLATLRAAKKSRNARAAALAAEAL